MDFCHLHVHTEYSLLDGYTKVSKIPERLKSMGMDSCAITDHGVMFGAVQFYKTLKSQGIKPIIGCETYLTENINEKDPKKKPYHLILLVENEEGYKNLISLISKAQTEGFYYKPRIDFNALREKHKGLIALSACLAGEIPWKFLAGDEKGARGAIDRYLDIFGRDNFFLEIQDHGISEERRVNEFLKKMSKETGVGLVATNDCHYLEKKDAIIHDCLLCIQTQAKVSDEHRMKFPSSEFYLKSPEEMAEIFKDSKDALENTVKIAERCNFDFKFGTYYLPEFHLPEGILEDKKDYLRRLTYEGLKERYGKIDDELKMRADYELSIIENMGFTDYFLIVRDFIHYAKTESIPVGPGRGSAAGSIVSYAIGITEIDPIKHKLLFERFLNPERVSMPDIDVDFCYVRRDEVIEYVKQKYGNKNVAQIATFGTMQAKGAIRDVARALDVPLFKADKLAKSVPFALNMTLDRALEESPELKKSYDEDEEARKVIDYAKAIEGMPRHVSTHAAGVVITKEPITHYVPLVKAKESIATQYNMTELEELGLLKMDFLGLRTLTVIKDAIEMTGKKIDLSQIDEKDPKIFEIFQKGETIGIFQFESEGMRSFLRELKPTEFEDLVAANSLYRPGPMSQIPKFVAGKHDPSSISYPDPKLEKILKPTYGCIVWQEQVIEIFRDLAGFSMGRADLVRRAMSKKKMKVMEAEREVFIHGDGNIHGAVKNGISEQAANEIYDLMIDFAKYAFNKSHSAAYSVVAYQTAYLKVYCPNEFMAALLTSMLGDTKQVAKYIAEANRMGLKVSNPDIQRSSGSFRVVDGEIIFGLYAVKNVGEGFIKAIVKAREAGAFKDFRDFIKRVDECDSSAINKRAVESLIFAGAFDSLGVTRSYLMKNYENIIDFVHSDNRNNIPGQLGFFEEVSMPEIPVEMSEEFPLSFKLEKEKEVLGLYVSGNPLDNLKDKVEIFGEYNTGELSDLTDDPLNYGKFDGKTVRIAGVLSEKKIVSTKKNDLMAFIKIEDFTGEIEGIAFPKFYGENHDKLESSAKLLFTGRIMLEEDNPVKIALSVVEPLEELEASRIELYFPSRSSELVRDAGEIAKNNPGGLSLRLCYEDTGKFQTARAKVDIKSVKDFRRLLGRNKVRVY